VYPVRDRFGCDGDRAHRAPIVVWFPAGRADVDCLAGTGVRVHEAIPRSDASGKTLARLAGVERGAFYDRSRPDGDSSRMHFCFRAI